MADSPATPPTLSQLARYFLRLGTFGFGGPIALAGYMQRDLVEQRGWIAETDFKQGLALAQLAPGPLAAQLAIYLGWVRGRLLGATVVALAFILPSFAMVLGLAALYVHFGGLSWMQGVFYGIGAAVIAIIARSAWKLGKSTLGKRWLLWGVALGNAALPCYLFVVIPAPFYRRIADNRRIKAFVDGVTAAAAGAIAGAAVVLARRAIVDLPAGLLAVATLAAVTWIKKVPEPIVILVAGAIGFGLWTLR